MISLFPPGLSAGTGSRLVLLCPATAACFPRVLAECTRDFRQTVPFPRGCRVSVVGSPRRALPSTLELWLAYLMNNRHYFAFGPLVAGGVLILRNREPDARAPRAPGGAR